LKNLLRLGYSQIEARKKLALIELTLREARNETEGVTWKECFRRSNLRRTMVAIMPYNLQTFTGISFVAGYFTYYLQLAGYSTAMSYRLQISQPVVSIVGNIMAATLVDRVGRRNLTFYGVVLLTAFLLITGGLGTGRTQPMIEGTVAFILIFSWAYNVTIGSTAFSLLAEVATPRLRAKTAAIGYATHAVLGVLWQFCIPYMFNPDKGNLGAKVGFVFGGLSVLSIVYFFFWQPETAGRSYQELDEMFAKGIPARQFKAYKTDVQALNAAAAQEAIKM
jgi:MFS transporter, SP family, general alpha glucoside:H+ symporter